ncbi:MAG: hypothetical protein DRQ49_03545 [Gammaproteobacteria bacterium]|nr:MAG: hypothetical protein DRQ49_03545 [Gammaproteobacteria bacterium]RKZ76154.1 MAG: hypothetical protein DRQ57_04880 [Gammaproteobacteria bacterium]
MSTTIDDFRIFFSHNKEKTFSITEKINETLSLLEASIKYHNIALIFFHDKKIVIDGLVNEFSQVLINIINNAKDAILKNNVKRLLSTYLFGNDCFVLYPLLITKETKSFRYAEINFRRKLIHNEPGG